MNTQEDETLESTVTDNNNNDDNDDSMSDREKEVDDNESKSYSRRDIELGPINNDNNHKNNNSSIFSQKDKSESHCNNNTTSYNVVSNPILEAIKKSSIISTTPINAGDNKQRKGEYAQLTAEDGDTSIDDQEDENNDDNYDSRDQESKFS